MGKLKFCANLSWMFKEADFLDRYKLAADAGFKGVEVAFPYDQAVDDIVKAKNDSGVEQILLNTGNQTTMGSAANFEDQKGFRDEFELGVKYATALGCKRLHVTAGFSDPSRSREKSMVAYVENLRYASGVLQENGMIGVIEPIQNKTWPKSYFLNTSVQAMEVLDLVDRPNIFYQLDFFHLQLMEGNLTANIKNCFPKIGHIQISQVPHRNEPFTSGEIEYSYIFNLLEELGYEGWLGCEYNPATTTSEGLKWFTDYMAK